MIVPADVLYEYGSAYTDLTVVTAITIESASTGMLQANTPNNDTYSFSITADFKDRDEIKGLSKGDTCIISGVVEAMNPINFLGSGKSVRMNDCHIITGSISKSDIEAARQAQVQFANNRLTEVAQAKAQAIEE